MCWRFTTAEVLRILHTTTLKNTGDNGWHTSSFIPTPSVPNLIYGTTQCRRISQSRNIMPLLNKAQIAFLEAWPGEVRQTLSCDAFVFNMKNHDLMQKYICEKATLNHAKAIAKIDESSKATTQHISGNDKAEVHMLHHKHCNVPPPKSKYKGQKWKQHYNSNSSHKKQRWNKLTRINSPKE